MIKDREITVYGSKAICHSSELFPDEITINFNTSIEMLKNEIQYLHENEQQKFIIIQGKTGSGKSTFGKVLKSNSNNVCIIDIYKLKSLNNQIDIIKKMEDSNKTYIIDEAYYCDVNELNQAIKKHIYSRGLVILLMQSIQDIKFDIEPSALFELTRDGLQRLVVDKYCFQVYK